MLILLMGSLMPQILKNMLMILLFLAFLKNSFNYPLWEFCSTASEFHLLSSTISSNLITLTAWISIMMLIASSLNQDQSTLFNSLVFCLFLILIIAFKVSNLLAFYFAFETALLPIFLLIMGWGYQPERLSAGLNLMIYTVIASLPLLLTILILVTRTYSNNFILSVSSLTTGAPPTMLTSAVFFALIAGFLVKYPMYAVHLWLPKAHVEAPVAGSMILAAILLKLGGYGLIRLSPVTLIIAPTAEVVKSFALMGGTVISMLCIRQTDMKVLIAYSSIAHMSLAIACTMAGTTLALWGGFIMMIAHGLASSGMFSAANVLYARWKTRNILLSKSTLTTIPVFSLFWFCLCICNMGAPPSLNLIGEVMSIVSMLNDDFLFAAPLAAIASLAVAYTLILYANSQQGQLAQSKKEALSLSMRDMTLLFSHSFSAMALIVWVFLLL